MPANIYEVLSLAMRYVFTLVGVLIVWRTFSWLRKDRRLKHQRLKQLRDAGTIGVFVVVFGSPELPEGMLIPVPHEGVLGSLRTCDIVVPAPGVATRHLDFSFVNGEGLHVFPVRGCTCTVDGAELHSHRDGRVHHLQHGSLLTVGDATLRLGVFDGLDVAQYVPEEPLFQPPEYAPEFPPEEFFPYDTPYDEEAPQ